MQTFLTSFSYKDTAKTLDNLRLNKQALEGWQILMNLLALDPAGNHREPKGWSNHPAVKMWRGHEMELAKYILAMVDEWITRGYKSTIGDKVVATIQVAFPTLNISKQFIQEQVFLKPEWMEDKEMYEQVVSTHRRALLVKNYAWYSQFNWSENPGYPPLSYEYVWPTQ